MIEILKDETLKEWMNEYPYIATFMEETDNTLVVNVVLHKWKWMCENCNHAFDDPEWLESPSSENPICPECESLNIDLTASIIKHKTRTT